MPVENEIWEKVSNVTIRDMKFVFEPVSIPGPVVVDTSHENDAYMTLGFGDKKARDEFLKFMSRRELLYRASVENK